MYMHTHTCATLSPTVASGVDLMVSQPPFFLREGHLGQARHTERAGRHSLTHTHTHASRHGMPQVAESLSSPQPCGLRMIASARSRWPTVNTVRPSLDLET